MVTLKKVKSPEKTSRERPERPVVVPYTHKSAHNLKRVGARYGVPVVFSSAKNMAGLINAINCSRHERTDKKECDKKHATSFVPCKKEVIYQVPFTCGKVYVGQTGRCLNDRLREHRAALSALRLTIWQLILTGADMSPCLAVPR